jgi:hypothetical protein
MARVFKEEHRELIDAYQQKEESLGDDLLETTYLDLLFSIDDDLLEEEERKNA